MSAQAGYSRAQVLLHWGVMVLVLLQIVLHNGIDEAWDVGEDTGSFSITPGVVIHFAIGSMILGLTMWRFGLRRNLGVPPPSAETPPVFQRLSQVVHWAFYALLILLPVTGAIAWGQKSFALAETHEFLLDTLLICIGLHVVGALYHAAVAKDGVLSRMDPRKF